jgi:ribosome biogenesis protein ENP2
VTSDTSIFFHGRLYEAKDEVHAQAFKNQVSLAKRRNQPLEERLTAFQKPRNQWQQDTEFGEEVRGRGGSRQLSFTPRSSSDRGGGFRGSSRGRGGEKGSGGSGDRDFKKRGIQSLGLKNDRSFKGGRGGRGSFRGRGRGRGRS